MAEGVFYYMEDGKKEDVKLHRPLLISGARRWKGSAIQKKMVEFAVNELRFTEEEAWEMLK